jgi:hypothetical protein
MARSVIYIEKMLYNIDHWSNIKERRKGSWPEKKSSYLLVLFGVTFLHLNNGTLNEGEGS